MDISRLQIDQSKMLASGAEYFKLFEKHLPTGLDSSKTVLVYEISNLSCIKKIAGLNPEAKHIIVGSKACNRALKMLLPKSIAVEYLEEFDFKETDMKFDCIIMNPPYQRNLHLKILAEAIKHLKDENSICINLSPMRWLKDPLAKWKKTCDLTRFKDSIAKHIKNLDICDSAELTKIFSAGMTFDIGIYKCIKAYTSFNCYAYAANPILDKVIPKITGLPIQQYKNNKKCTFVPITFIDGGHKERTNSFTSSFSICRPSRHYGDYFVNGISTNGKTLEQCKNDNKRCTNGNVNTWPIIVFNTETEVKNFVAETKTLFFKYIYKETMVDVNVHPDFLPWLGDIVNPRTGKKGYESEWTDDDLYKLFNLTQDEIKIIEDTMKKYKQ